MKKTLVKRAKSTAKRLLKALKKPDYRDPEVDRLIRLTAKKAKWSYAKTWKMMNASKEAFGIPYEHYYKNAFWRVPPVKQEALYKRSVASADAARKEKAHTVECVMKHTGWDRDYTDKMIREACRRRGCTYKEYLMYRFFELDEKTQDEVFLVCDSKKLRAKYDTDKDFLATLSNKERTNRMFSELVGRPWCVNKDVTYKTFKKLFSGSSKIFYKPIVGSCGRGASAYDINAENMEAVYNELTALPKGLIEEYVVQHPAINRLSPSSVNTLRLATVSSPSFPVTPDGKYVDLAYAALRIGGGTSVVDNFHSGGMVAAVDTETGTIITDAIDMESNIYKTHPVSGETIKGVVIPFFREAVDAVLRECREKKLTGYLGWDIAITEKGPVLIELNSGPGVMLLSSPHAIEHRGMKYVMDKYL